MYAYTYLVNKADSDFDCIQFYTVFELCYSPDSPKVVFNLLARPKNS